ncbi:peptide deformylase [Aliishimia ponticola]|uniref:Peptide deformylase n=1 Tax=Aliishimia ponticola TaxID=2499833 RepID=A0A4S4NAK7_9RHOB|nr:peptide deformylase [Aliishimia ponticola]THH35068.1 peptide deformylase [Aliishimia ponticola]
MSVLPILRWPDPRLGAKCEVVGALDDDLRALVEDMFETMYDAEGRGLAAPQVGVLKRIFVMDVAWKSAEPEPAVFVNPVIRDASAETCIGPEGCLSIPGITTDISRHARIFAGWIDLDGKRQERWLDGMDAICFQHELDHLDGKVTFDRLTPEMRASALAEYEATL